MARTILCVDDMPQCHREYDAELGFEYVVLHAENTDKAIEYLRNGSIDLILMDFQLGLENGIFASKRLRERGFTLPIIVVSSDKPNERLVELAKTDYGVNDFVLKDSVFYRPLLEKIISEL